MSSSFLRDVVSSPIAQGLASVGVAITTVPTTTSGLIAAGTAGLMAMLISAVAQDQDEATRELVEGLHAQLQIIKKEYIDESFFDTREGKRLMSHVIMSVRRDSRKEKIMAMVHLASNLLLRTKLSVDEKELFVQTLDLLNPLQLAILKRVVDDMRGKTTRMHRGFGWELLRDQYEKNGISEALLLQAIRVLESNGLVNANTATVQESDRTHYITTFGEQFCDFCMTSIAGNEIYLLTT